MYAYEKTLAIEGTARRLSSLKIEKGLNRQRLLDSLLAERLHSLENCPDHLLYSSVDGLRPHLSNLFSRSTIVSSLNDFWNTMLKEPSSAACFVQVVDENPGQQEVGRTALEMSLFKVKPFDLTYFEELLEVQEQYFACISFRGLLVDSLQRIISIDSKNQEALSSHQKNVLTIEAVINPLPSVDTSLGGSSLSLRGRDCRVEDFRVGLRGTRDLFTEWDQWLGELSLHAGSFERIFIYSQVKGLLPACWEELRARGVSAEAIRLPQWAGFANAVSSYLEFLLDSSKRVAFIYLPIDGYCHFAEWGRLK